MNLKLKLPLVAILPGLVILSIFIATQMVIKQQKTDAVVINLSGRQRMLSQKMNKEVLMVLRSSPESQKATSNKKELENTIQLFEKTLEALSKGQVAPLASQSTDGIKCPPPSKKVALVLDTTARNWSALRTSVSAAVESRKDDSLTMAELEQLTSVVLNLSNRATELLQKESEERSSKLLTIQLIGLIIGLICIAWAILTASGVLKKLASINRLVEQFSSGNLTERIIGIKETDELDDALIRVNRLGESIAAVVSEIYAANSTLMNVSEEFSSQFVNIASNAESVKSRSNTVAAAAEQASSSVNSISAGAEEMSVSVTNVAGSMEQMSATIDEVARSCIEESKAASEADRQVKSAHEVISRLGNKAVEIGRIVDVISEIAAKTNLLALNAAIEAASAGSAGKGFAVVASEVKELAKQTAKATGEIQTQIENVQNDVSMSVSAIQLISELIEKVNTISQTIVAAVEEQSATSSEVAKNLSGASEAASSIARNVSETAMGITEVSSNIQNVNSETADVADSIVSSRQKVLELKKLSDDLKQVVSAFRIEGKFLEWSPQFSVGVDQMDDQHKVLISMINNLNDALASGKAKETVGVVLNDLLVYTETHFAQEEAFMKKGGYAELEGHIKIHRAFTGKIKELQIQYAQGTAMVSRDVMVFLKDWLINHIAKMDKRYGAVLGKKR